MTMNQIQYNPKDYELIRTQEMDEELIFKLVKFSTGYYGVLSYNPLINAEKVILLSSDNDESNNEDDLFNSLACQSFLIFANDAKKYVENAPLELVIKLGKDAAEEYREVITREQGDTLYEKAGICYEIMNMKLENSFFYKYSDIIQTVLYCLIITMVMIAVINILQLYGVLV